MDFLKAIVVLLLLICSCDSNEVRFDSMALFEESATSATINPSTESTTESATMPMGASSYYVTGPPSTAAAASRQRLLSLLTHPFNRQQNIDQLPTHVMVKLLPIKIQDLNEKSEVLETTIRLQMTWRDARLVWNPKSYYNVTELVIPGNLIWSPDVGILNSVSDIYHVIRDTRFEMKVESIGRVWWHPTGIVKTYCKLHLRYFPFDKQKCKLVLESPTLDMRFMNLTLRFGVNPVDTIMYMGGETWELVSVNGFSSVNKVGSKTKFSRVEFVIHVQRAKIYHLLNVILPAIFLSMVQVMFFLLPATHPQRVGSSTTTLLSVVVFHSVAVSQLPKTSTDVPLLAVYIFIVTFVSGLSVCTSIFVAKFAVYTERNEKMPKWLRSIPHPFHHAIEFGRSLSRKRHPAKVNDNDKRPVSPAPAGPQLATIPEFSLRNVVNQDDHDKRISRYENAEDEPMLEPDFVGPNQRKSKPERKNEAFLFNTWNDVSTFVDVALMLTAMTVATLSPLVMFVVIPRIVDDDYS